MKVLSSQQSTGTVFTNAAAISNAESLRHPLRVVHTVSSLMVGGMEHFVLRIARAQQNAGHHVTVVALKDGPLSVEAGELGLSVVLPNGNNKAVRALHGAALFAQLRPHVINVHNQTSLHYGILGKRLSGAKVVLTNHGQGLGSARQPSHREWQLTDAIVTVSQAVSERMDTAHIRNKITTIHNGIDPQPARCSRADVRKELGMSEERVIGTIVARIDNLKGHDTLLRALAALRREYVADSSAAKVTILIAGDGAERGNRERLAQELGLGPVDVRFLGFRSDVPDLLAASDFFTLPSLTEGLPLSVLEAMASGLPIVATPVGGIPELVQEGEQGYLVPVNDPDSLAQAIARIAESASLRISLGEAGRRRVREHFSFAAMVEKYDDLYRRLLCGTH